MSGQDMTRMRALRSRTRSAEPGIEVWCNGRGTHDAKFLRRLSSAGDDVTDYGDVAVPIEPDIHLAGERGPHFEMAAWTKRGPSYRFTCPACRLDERATLARLATALVAAQEGQKTHGKKPVFIHELLA